MSVTSCENKCKIKIPSTLRKQYRWSAAVLIKGVTLHSATGLENKKYKINDVRRQK